LEKLKTMLRHLNIYMQKNKVWSISYTICEN
jgi:hypothetical protein